MTHLPQNRRRGGRPDERFGMAVVMRHVLFDRANEIGDAAERAPTNPLAGDLGEPPFDQIEPRRARGNEVSVIARMGGEPGLDGRMRVGAVVVQDQMNVAPLRDRAIELLQEGQELGVPLAGAHRARTVPSRTFNAANRFVVPCRM